MAKQLEETRVSDRPEYEIEENYVSTNIRARPRKIRYFIDSYGCWICTSHAGSNYRGGYPVIRRFDKYMRMSRYIYWLFNGHIDDELYVMHSCDNPKCINPDHLSLGTPQENTDDMVKKGRNKVGEDLPFAKLTESQVIKIFNDPRGCTTIAREYNVSKKTVLNIRHGKTWKHLYLTKEAK